MSSPKTVWLYETGDTVKSFDTEEEAQAWFDIHDPEGVAFKHELSELRPVGSADLHGVPRAEE
jgi:viroplasmin and RNaseH domain-containing protein